MLAGIPGVKQDRMVIRFVSSATGLTKRRSVRLTRRPSYGLPQSSSTCRPRPLITPSGGFNLAGAATTLAEPQPHCALMEAQGARAPTPIHDQAVPCARGKLPSLGAVSPWPSEQPSRKPKRPLGRGGMTGAGADRL